MKILAIDTSNKALAIGLWEDGLGVGNHLINIKKNHSILLMPVIQDLMEQVGWQPKDLNRIVVAEGPGSYTGLRIGVTTGKTLAWTLDCELVGISSLKTLAANSFEKDRLIVPLFDARRQNVYTGAYTWKDGQLVNKIADQHISLTKWLEILKNCEMLPVFIGEDVKNFKAEILEVFQSERVFSSFPSMATPDGLRLAELGSEAEDFKNPTTFVPVYLKRVEAEEKWLETHKDEGQNYVEKI